jgi:hypothetical protein
LGKTQRKLEENIIKMLGKHRENLGDISGKLRENPGTNGGKEGVFPRFSPSFSLGKILLCL